MTDMVLARREYRPDGIFSTLTDGTSSWSTLEHAYEDFDGRWGPKIPPGLYTCVRGMHVLADGVPFTTFEITGVVGHTGLLFHAGNFDRDSEGCVLIGEEEQGAMVTNSRAALAAFLASRVGVYSFQLTVVA
jgi:hypothetical protein